jgi:branched-chain amino acid transport system substrate-binding protein
MTDTRSVVGALCAVAVAAFFGTAAAEETIKFGMCTPMTGPAADQGHLQNDGAKLAVERINAAGGALGRKFEMVMEDDQTTNPGIVLCFSRLVNRGDLVAVISSIRSTQVNAMSPDAKKAAIPVFIGGTDPTLTKVGNPWLFRTRPNDSYSAKVMAEFGVNELKKKKWAVVHATDAFGSAGAKALTEELKTLGIEPVIDLGYTNGQADLTPIVLAVRKSGADIMASYMPFETDVAVLARQMKQLGVEPTWIGSASNMATTARDLAGDALHGTYVVCDFNADSNPVARVFYDDFMKRVGRGADHVSAWAYDAVFLLAEAIRKAGSTEPDKIRAALLSIKDFPGVEGKYTYDQNGDGLRGYNVVKNEGGKIVFVKYISFEK